MCIYYYICTSSTCCVAIIAQVIKEELQELQLRHNLSCNLCDYDMQFVTIFVCLAFLSAVQAHHHCCKCCTQGENKCSLSGTPTLCKQTTGVLAM